MRTYLVTWEGYWKSNRQFKPHDPFPEDEFGNELPVIRFKLSEGFIMRPPRVAVGGESRVKARSLSELMMNWNLNFPETSILSVDLI